MILFANAKINLGLNIKGKRPDGYYNLETILYPIPFYDVIEFFPSEKFSLHLYGEILSGPPEENLVSKAFQLMRHQFSIPEIEIHLLKNIPPGTGLGGGSSDAARLLFGINQIFHLGLNDNSLRKMSESLGSDCPFFIENTPAFASGRGEKLEKVNLGLKGYFLVLVIPNFTVSTSKAYAQLKEPFEQISLLHEIENKPMEAWGDSLTNDFEHIVFSEHPEYMKIKSNLMEDGAIYSSLTGSGSAVYGIYKKRPLFIKQRPDMKFLIFQL
jgi:4-diphosphocytidyl-2-C-methyl-D-erythritol kinase